MAKKTCHFVKRRNVGYVCDNCGGWYEGAKRPVTFDEIPPWMVNCPTCGLKITCKGRKKYDETDVPLLPLEDTALLMLRMVPANVKESVAKMLLEDGVPQDAVAMALELGDIEIKEGEDEQV